MSSGTAFSWLLLIWSNTLSAHLVDLVVLAGIRPFEKSVNYSLLANSKRCGEIEGSGLLFELHEGSGSLFDGFGWLPGWSFVLFSFAHSVHSHIPRQNGEKSKSKLG